MLGAPPYREIGSLEQAYPRIVNEGLDALQVGTGRQEGESGLVEVQGAFPSLGRNHTQLALELQIVLRPQRELAQRHPVAHGDRQETNRRSKSRVEHIALHRASDRIRPGGTPYGNPGPG